ncbi:MAG TPA: hypothetical protein VI193_07365 [Acidimicrobiia bacterium]
MITIVEVTATPYAAARLLEVRNATTAAVETTTTAPAPIVPGEDADVDAVVAIYGIAFDSATTFDEKAVVIVDPAGLEETVTAYATTGEAMGGVTTQVDAVVIDGDNATVTYTLMFAGTPTYSGLQGDAIRTADGWMISRDMFCGIMSSARVGCPTG